MTLGQLPDGRYTTFESWILSQKDRQDDIGEFIRLLTTPFASIPADLAHRALQQGYKEFDVYMEKEFGIKPPGIDDY